VDGSRPIHFEMLELVMAFRGCSGVVLFFEETVCLFV
jgi:hypothetical protein